MSNERAYPRGERQEGFTIIELVVALGLLAIVAASMSGVFWAAMRTAGASDHRSDGASIASREIEAMRSFKYSDIGFYRDQLPSGYDLFTDPDSGQSLHTVFLGATTPAGDPANIQPLTPDPNASASYAPDPDPNNALPVTQGGVQFTVQRFIGWVGAQDASTTFTEAYKQTLVVVTWRDQAGLHSIHQSSIVYPGGQGQYNGPRGAAATTSTPTTTLLLPGQPTLSPITVPGAGSLALGWTAPTSGAAVTSYSIEYSTDPSFPAGNFTVIGNPAANTLAPTITSYTLTGLADSTTYYVEIIAYNGTNAGQPSASQSAMTPAPPPTCTFGPLSVAGASSKSTTGTILNKQGKMSENLTLTWSTSGTGMADATHSCADTFDVTSVNSGGGADPQGGVLTAGSPGAYTGTVGSNNKSGWSTGVHAFTVYDVTTGSATSVVKTFTVCAFGAATC